MELRCLFGHFLFQLARMQLDYNEANVAVGSSW